MSNFSSHQFLSLCWTELRIVSIGNECVKMVCFSWYIWKSHSVRKDNFIFNLLFNFKSKIFMIRGNFNQQICFPHKIMFAFWYFSIKNEIKVYCILPELLANPILFKNSMKISIASFCHMWHVHQLIIPVDPLSFSSPNLFHSLSQCCVVFFPGGLEIVNLLLFALCFVCLFFGGQLFVCFCFAFVLFICLLLLFFQLSPKWYFYTFRNLKNKKKSEISKKRHCNGASIHSLG